MESGRVRNRRDYLEPMETLEVQWSFIEEEFGIFKAFFDQTLENGSQSFTFNVFGEDKEMAFLDGNYSFSHSDNLVSVVATLEYLPVVINLVIGGEGGGGIGEEDTYAIGGEGGELIGQEVSP